MQCWIALISRSGKQYIMTVPPMTRVRDNLLHEPDVDDPPPSGRAHWSALHCAAREGTCENQLNKHQQAVSGRQRQTNRFMIVRIACRGTLPRSHRNPGAFRNVGVAETPGVFGCVRFS
ncbi:MAG: hypothetical protein Fues2KO_48690 [Fuerstiella sp.]